MGWLDTIGTVLNTAAAMAQATQVNKWLNMDLGDAAGEVVYLVNNYPTEVIDAYETVFLRATLFVFDPEQRVKLMKLYAVLKMTETERYGFRGFANV